jgi:hypothetical protein
MKVPQKVVLYFPITPRLNRYFVDPKEAKLMQWHVEREKPGDDPEKGTILTCPADASQWLALDMEDGFGDDARNIRLGMSIDGLNPFGNQSSTHSTWPVLMRAGFGENPRGLRDLKDGETWNAELV